MSAPLTPEQLAKQHVTAAARIHLANRFHDAAYLLGRAKNETGRAKLPPAVEALLNIELANAERAIQAALTLIDTAVRAEQDGGAPIPPPDVVAARTGPTVTQPYGPNETPEETPHD